ITVDISKGIATSTVPDVIGLTETQAGDALRIAGFSVKPKYEISETVPAGCVIRTTPDKNAPTTKGAEITVYISSGSLVKKISVPNLIGKYEREAMDAIRDAGLDYSVAYQDDNSSDSGKVIRQSPSKGTLVDPNTVITITVTQKSGV
ncbi:MAG: PASTA domain-containing protein, partial [Clostridia bacterium]